MDAVIHTLAGFNFWSITFRILLATLIGGCIGSERGRHGRAAGLRTHILVCLGSTMTTLLGIYSVQVLGLSGDPLRVSAQVVSGIGFLGAGTILTRNHTHVTGLTTAAGLWATACLGLAIGIGCYSAALIAWAVIMLTITVLARLERGVKRTHTDTYYLELCDINRVNEFSREMGSTALSLQVLQARSQSPGHIGLELVTRSTTQSNELLEQLRTLPYVAIALPVTEAPV
ncbi:MAG: MgtC/SapB family protein [Ruminococcaceae bacterium]|nr:MgtC/SapB family protein [Oscillospiraceae bacterium]